MANTLAYYDTAVITTVQSFIEQAPGVLSLYGVLFLLRITDKIRSDK
jgi:hypothetical protein